MCKRAKNGGGKGGGSQYDPQIGAATQATAAVAARAEAFSEQYYTEVITPLLRQSATASANTEEKLGKLYDINYDNTVKSNDRYEKYGIPAESRYYDMVDKYSAPEEEERQAMAAKGDLGVAQANQKGALNRQMASMGIDPTSPAAVAAATDASVMNTAAEASAMNRARNAARTLGMQLTSDASNFGRGGQSGILQFGAGAQGNATAAAATAQGALGAASNAASGVQAGFNTAVSGYSNNANVYSKMGAADIQASSQGGFGQLLGTLGGAALGNTALMSDRRLKRDIIEVSVLPSGIKLYLFRYLDSDETHFGVMAQEVLPVIPEAVVMCDNGFYAVDYGKLR